MQSPYQHTPPHWHTLTIEETLSALKTSAGGLSAREAAERLQAYGLNELQASQRISPWQLLLDQFKNVLIIILLIAAVFAAFFGEGPVDAIAITVIVLFAVILGFVQEYRAERALEALQQMAAPTATVLRDGKEIEVLAREVVPGDVILLRAGDKVPADARLLEAVNLQIEEAALTGESVPLEKHTAPLQNGQLTIGDRKNMVYAGTAATYGRGRAVIVATGMNTEFGQIAQLLQTVEGSKTPLQENLDRLGHILARAALVIVTIIVALGLFRGQPLIQMILFGIALAVAVVPEALPAVVTVSLAIGVQRMVKRNALVRRLPAVETLGSVSVICSDKTGTLTKDEMTVRKVYAAEVVYDVSGAGYEPVGEFSHNGATATLPDPLQQLLRGAVLASDAYLVQHESEQRWQVKGDPTEGALVVAAAKAGLYKSDLEKQYPRINEIPFTSETKRMTTLHETRGERVAYSKGAPEIILESCIKHLTVDGEVPLDAAGKECILETAQQMASEAMRVLAVARRSAAGIESAEHDMTFLGLLGMIDPPRPEAKVAIQTCEQAGIKVVMITGDHPLTAAAVARELGLLKHQRIVTGAELEAMSDQVFSQEVETIEVYARVSPAHKLRVVTALQARGHIVAMTGDGVNDAPALKKADIGIAMGITGTDVTKEAAAMTLTDDNFASIVAAVEEGRGIFGNIKKYLMYLLSANVGEIILMASATMLNMPLPLETVQILYINLATDGLPALALSVDPPESDLMNRPPRNPRTGIFTRPVVALMLIGGAWLGIVNLLLFSWALSTGRSADEARTMTFVSVVLFEFFKAYSFRSDRHSIFRHALANKWLNLAILWELVLLSMIVYLPFLQGAFHTFSLTRADWMIVLGLSITVIPVLELGKWMVRRGRFGPIQ